VTTTEISVAVLVTVRISRVPDAIRLQRDRVRLGGQRLAEGRGQQALVRLRILRPAGIVRVAAVHRAEEAQRLADLRSRRSRRIASVLAVALMFSRLNASLMSRMSLTLLLGPPLMTASPPIFVLPHLPPRLRLLQLAQ
jgi:hypothetical protein